MNIKRLKKILMLAFENSNDQERLAALDMVKHLLELSGKDTHWLVAQLDLIQMEPKSPSRFTNWSRRQQPPAQRHGSWRGMIEYLARPVALGRLNEREHEFVLSVSYQMARKGEGWAPSARQINWLSGIYQRLKVTDF